MGGGVYLFVYRQENYRGFMLKLLNREEGAGII